MIIFVGGISLAFSIIALWYTAVFMIKRREIFPMAPFVFLVIALISKSVFIISDLFSDYFVWLSFEVIKIFSIIWIFINVKGDNGRHI